MSTQVITGRNIDRFYLRTLLISLKSYVRTGMKMNRGLAPTTIVKKSFGLKGGGEDLIRQLEIICKNADQDIWPTNYVFRNSEDKRKTL